MSLNFGIFQDNMQYDDDGNALISSLSENAGKTETQKLGSYLNASDKFQTAIYTVPEGKVLYLTSLALHSTISTATVGTHDVRVYLSVEGTTLANMSLGYRNASDPYTNNSMVLTYTMPIKLNAGEIIKVTIPAAVTSSILYTGWFDNV